MFRNWKKIIVFATVLIMTATGVALAQGGESGSTDTKANPWWRESPVTQVKKAEEGDINEVNATII